MPVFHIKWRTPPSFNKTELEMHRIEALWSLSGTQMQIVFWNRIAMLLSGLTHVCRWCDFIFSGMADD